MPTSRLKDLDGAVDRLSRRRFLIQSGAALALTQTIAGQKVQPEPRSECVFCKIVAGSVPAHKIWEDKEFLAFLDNKPINPGHTLLVPKQHYDYLFDLPESKYERITKLTRRLAGPLRTATESKRIGIIVEGFGVAHCHIHLVPINKGGELIKKGVVGVTDEEFEAIASKIRPLFRKI